VIIVDLIKKIVNLFKVDIIKYPNSDLRRRQKLLRNFNINKILDVGANVGQYAQLTRKLGYKGEIISFEPIQTIFKKLELKTIKDEKWKAYNIALGKKEEVRQLNISENTYSSSLLEITSNHLHSAPESIYVDKERIKVKKLQDIYDDLVEDGDVVFLKIDVQGFEKNVIDGAHNILHKIKGIQLEMSIVELYKGEMLFSDMINHLGAYGFKPYSLENGFYNDKTGQLLQVDGFFFRE